MSSKSIDNRKVQTSDTGTTEQTGALSPSSEDPMLYRYIKHSHYPPEPHSAELESTKQEIFAALITNVQRVQKHTPDGKSRPTGGVYVGVAGTVVMNYHLASLPIPVPHHSLSPDNLLSQGVKHLRTALCLNPTGLSLPYSPSHASFLETAVGIATLALLKSIKTQSDKGHLSSSEESTEWRSCAQILQSTCQMAISEDEIHSNTKDDDGCEVLYGRAGLLYALLLVRREIPNVPSSPNNKNRDNAIAVAHSIASLENIEKLVDSIIVRGRTGANRYAASMVTGCAASHSPPDLMWTWHRKRYLGAAHGVAGILQIVLLSPAAIVGRYATEILNTALWLIDNQDPFGNWPSKAPDLEDEGDSYVLSSRSARKKGMDSSFSELVQWCHGAPGTIIMLCTLLRRATITPQNFFLASPHRAKILASVLRGASVVYRRGLLRKGVGLCHGVAGSVYALLAVSNTLRLLPSTGPDAADTLVVALPSSKGHPSDPPAELTPTSPEYHLMRAAHLARLATTHETLTAQREMNIPDRPWSLYEGMAGMCCAWGDVLAKLQPVSPATSPDQHADSATPGLARQTPGKAGLQSGMPGFDDIKIDEYW